MTIPSRIFTNYDRHHPAIWVRVALIVATAVLTVGLLQETLQALNQGYFQIPGLIEDLEIDLVGGLAGLLVS